MSNNAIQMAVAPRCDRTEYIGWCEGVLMHYREGRGFIVNTTAARAADAALKAMSIVVLTQENEPITVLVPRGTAVEECTIDQWLKEDTCVMA